MIDPGPALCGIRQRLDESWEILGPVEQERAKRTLSESLGDLRTLLSEVERLYAVERNLRAQIEHLVANPPVAPEGEG